MACVLSLAPTLSGVAKVATFCLQAKVGARFFISGAAAATLGWCGLAFSEQIPDSRCSSLTTVEAAGYEYAYPSSWVMDKVRGIEAVAYDPNMEQLNMTITSIPAERAQLGSPEQLGENLLARYKSLPSFKHAEILSVDSSDDGTSRRYKVEVRVFLNDELRHYFFGILKSDKKVYTLVLQVPEDLWELQRNCSEGIFQKLRIR